MPSKMDHEHGPAPKHSGDDDALHRTAKHPSALSSGLSCFLASMKPSRFDRFNRDRIFAGLINQVGEGCQYLGLTILGTALFFLGSLLDTESLLRYWTRPGSRRLFRL